MTEIDGFFFYLSLYYYKIQIIFFNFLKMLIIPNKIYDYFIYKIKKIYKYIVDNMDEKKSFYIYKNQFFKKLEIKYLNYFIKIYYFIILKYILTPLYLLINIFEKLQFIYEDFLIKNFDFYYIDLIFIYFKTFF